MRGGRCERDDMREVKEDQECKVKVELYNMKAGGKEESIRPATATFHGEGVNLKSRNKRRRS